MGPPYEIYLFINPSSGGNKAGAYLTDVGSDHIKIRDEDLHCNLYIFNIKDGKPGDKPGFHAVRKACESAAAEQVRVLAGGGDGTVMWCMSELEKHEVPNDKVAVGVIPFGTGNDFSRATGWGGKAPKELLGEGLAQLFADIKTWAKADSVPFDVWQVEIETFPGGGFLFVDDKVKTCHDGHIAQHGITKLAGGGMKMSKPMCNYTSFGYMARVGLGMEKARSKTRFGNLVRYGWEGGKKLTFTTPSKVNDVLKEVKISKQNIDVRKSLSTVCDSDEDKYPMETITFNGDDQCHFTKTSRELIFLNIPSIAAGANPWAWSDKVGATGIDGSLLAAEQDFGDGKIELISYHTAFGVSTDTMAAKIGWAPGMGRGNKLASCRGPFELNFKDPTEAKYVGEGKVYFQIDGECFVVNQPKSLILRHGRTVRVMKNDLALAGKGGRGGFLCCW